MPFSSAFSSLEALDALLAADEVLLSVEAAAAELSAEDVTDEVSLSP